MPKSWADDVLDVLEASPNGSTQDLALLTRFHSARDIALAAARRANVTASGQGSIGPQGPQGEQGDPGPPGPPGDTGPAGPEGPIGPQGPPGPQGPAGERGVTGDQGSAGPQGAPGPKGDTGDTGPPGATGPEGPQGDPGADSVVPGPQGEQGPAGPKGDKGDKGDTGDPGPEGTVDLSLVYPVGSLYFNTGSTSPATLLGFGTWARFGQGRVIVSQDSGQTEFDTAGETGGSKTHTLQTSEMPAHTHVQDAHTHVQNAHAHTQRHFPTATGGSIGQTIDTSMSGTQTNSGLTTADATAVNQNATAVNQNTGGGGAHNNLQPYIVVYVWERTA